MLDCILLDMDGVIADFVTASIKAADLPLTHDQVTIWAYYREHMTEDQFWEKVGDDERFWNEIEPYPWAAQLVAMCQEYGKVYFCSSPCLDPKSASAKIEWLRHHGFMGQRRNDYILTSHKGLLGNPSRVLIDDGDHNIEAFRKSGGQTILFPQPWNAAGKYEAEDLLATVQTELNRLTSSEPPKNPKDIIGATKPPQHCVPLPVLWEVGMGMFEGGWKYQDHNYRVIGVQASAYLDATRRHLDAWWEGEDIDPKSGLHHVTKAISGLFVLRDCMMQSAAGAPVEFIDDRPPKSYVTMEDMERQFAEMLERLKREHGDCKPPYTAKG